MQTRDLMFTAEQRRASQDLEVRVWSVGFEASEVRVGLREAVRHGERPALDAGAPLNPAWAWVSGAAGCASSSESIAKIVISNVSVGSKTVVVQAIPCDGGAPLTKTLSVNVVSWFRLSWRAHVATAAAVLLYTTLFICGLLGALRYQAAREGNQARGVANWVGFGVGVFAPPAFLVPIVNGFTSTAAAASAAVGAGA